MQTHLATVRRRILVFGKKRRRWSCNVSSTWRVVSSARNGIQAIWSLAVDIEIGVGNEGYSFNASSRLERMAGIMIRTTAMAAAASRPPDKGEVRNTVLSPRESTTVSEIGG